MAQTRTPITRIKFLSINRDIKAGLAAGTYNRKAIAEKHHVSRETVRKVLLAKTWGGWLTQKVTKQTSPKQSASEKELVTEVKTLEEKVESAKKAGLNPLTADQRAERKLAKELEALNHASIKELEYEQTVLTTRQHVVLERVRKVESTTWAHGVFLGLLLAVVIVTFVIAVVK